MREEHLGEIDQLVGFSYYSFKDGKFRRIYPTDLINGSIISANSDGTLKNLIYPCPVEKLEDALKKSRRENILNSRIVDMDPYSSKSIIYSGIVKSASFQEVPVHSVSIRNAHDFERVEMNCGCEKQTKRRLKLPVFEPRLKRYWGQKDDKVSESTCMHSGAIVNHLSKSMDSNVLGLDLDPFMKPYVLSFIEAIDRFPKTPNYALDYAYTYESSLFDGAKRQIDDMRKENDLEPLGMYKNPYLKSIIEHTMQNKSIRDIVGIVGY
ncbi:MAG: hypothetical protein V1678_02605 [Candidatus Aenigmatarchaeota archaeon]